MDAWTELLTGSSSNLFSLYMQNSGDSSVTQMLASRILQFNIIDIAKNLTQFFEFLVILAIVLGVALGFPIILYNIFVYPFLKFLRWR